MNNDEIRCPYCRHIQDNDDYAYPVSYWGSECGPTEYECDFCKKIFYVTEIVDRTYEVSKDKEGGL